MEKEKIGKFINELRKEKGITQKELAIQMRKTKSIHKMFLVLKNSMVLCANKMLHKS